MTVLWDAEAGIAGVTVRATPGYLLVQSSDLLRVVTTAPVGAHLTHARSFLSIPPPRDLGCADGAALATRLHAIAERLALGKDIIGFLTAVDLTRAVVVTRHDTARAVMAVATVGVSNATRPGERSVPDRRTGTINLVVVIDADLSPNALNEALTTAVEAKALAVYESGTRTADGLPATGTSTDAYAVACTGRGCRDQYAGAVTPIGFLVGRTVRDAVAQGLERAVRGTGGKEAP